MVTFNELRITNDGSYLFIDARLRKDLQTDDARISRIEVCDSSNYVEGTPDKTAVVYEWDENDSSQKPWEVSVVVNPKSYDYLPSDLTGKLLFVYVYTEGIDETSLPCGCSSPTIGVALSMNNIYKEFMNYINEIGVNCDNPKNLADFILKLDALLLAMDAQQYTRGIAFFNRWFSGEHYPTVTSNCGCHG